MKFYKQLINNLIDKYINDITVSIKNETFAVFEIIMNEYQKTNECPICSTNNKYSYNNILIACENNIFTVLNEPVQFVIYANYCPICGKEIY